MFNSETSTMRFVAPLLLAFLIVLPVHAQDDQLDDLNFEEVELPEEDVPYFAIGIGPVLNIAFPSLDALNTRGMGLGLDEMTTPMFQWGGEIFSAIGVFPNVRLGFSWVSGSSTTLSDTMQIADGVTGKRGMEYELGAQTIHVDYAFVPAKGFAIIPGVGFAFGSQRILTYQSVADRDWSDYDGTLINVGPDEFHEMDRTTYSVVPRLNFEYAFTPFIAIRGQAAYTLQIGEGSWTSNRLANVTGVPDDLSSSAFSAQVGLFVGLFN